MATARSEGRSDAPSEITEVVRAALAGAAEGGEMRERVAKMEAQYKADVDARTRLASDVEALTSVTRKLHDNLIELMTRFQMASKTGGWVMGIVGSVVGSLVTGGITALILLRR